MDNLAKRGSVVANQIVLGCTTCVKGHMKMFIMYSLSAHFLIRFECHVGLG